MSSVFTTRSSQARRVAMISAACLFSSLSACGGCDTDEQKQYDPFFEPYAYGEYEPVMSPVISAPREVQFGELEIGQEVERRIQVKNTGRQTLHIQRWSSTPQFPVRFEGFMDGAVPTRLEPKEEVTVIITYRAGEATPQEGVLVIESDATNAPRFEITLNANIKRPCLEVDPEETLDFGITTLGGASRRTITLRSCSTNTDTVVRLGGLRDNTGTYRLLEAPRSVTLGPGREVALTVEFTPPEPGAYHAALDLTSDDPTRPRRTVNIVGHGAPYACPQAVIRASAPGRQTTVASPSGTFRGLPLDVVSLSASDSADPEGQISRVEWTVVARPADSAAMLAEPAESWENNLYMDLSGEYTVELNVWNDRGIKSCAPARLELKAVPDEDIHVQLVWDTPNDRDQLDDNGSDVDIHLLRDGGKWNERPYDCFWQNLEPDWGLRNDAGDDPSLDIDDVNGWGPENINLNNPEVDTVYKVGVHYFSDHGFGASFATVRLYTNGELRAEARRKRMVDQQFWHVFNLRWPGTVEEVDQLYLTIPE